MLAYNWDMITMVDFKLKSNCQYHLSLSLGQVTEYFSTRARVRVMVLNATFNNISAISWRSVLLVEETGVSGENHRLVVSH